MISNYITTQDKKICILTKEGIIHIHQLLSTNYHLLKDMDPVSPAGVKNPSLLESAVDRQHVGSGNWYKYSNFFNNCATLTYGIIKNHAFHNGNKRTGLLSMIKHLYLNGYVLSPKLNSNEIYAFVLAVASNTLPHFSKRFFNKYNKTRKKKIDHYTFWSIDEEIDFMASWLKEKSQPKTREVKSNIKISKLRKILESKGLTSETIGSKIRIYEQKNAGLLGLLTGKKIKSNEKEYSLGGNLTEVPLGVLKRIRKDYSLTRNNGVDNVAFYDDMHFIENEIRIYKQIIYRLSKT